MTFELSAQADAFIPWQPIASMPEDRKDGRQVLLWADGRAFLACYMDEEMGWFSEPWSLLEATHWIDVSPPE